MDDFSVYGDSFDFCLHNFERVVRWYEETNLVSNWEICHFIVQEGIVLRHKIFLKGIEVDKAKIETIKKLVLPILVNLIRSFLGHAGSTKDLSSISRSLHNL